MSNFICPHCGMENIDCGQDGYKTAKEIQLEQENHLLRLSLNNKDIVKVVEELEQLKADIKSGVQCISCVKALRNCDLEKENDGLKSEKDFLLQKIETLKIENEKLTKIKNDFFRQAEISHEAVMNKNNIIEQLEQKLEKIKGIAQKNSSCIRCADTDRCADCEDCSYKKILDIISEE